MRDGVLSEAEFITQTKQQHNIAEVITHLGTPCPTSKSASQLTEVAFQRSAFRACCVQPRSRRGSFGSVPSGAWEWFDLRLPAMASSSAAALSSCGSSSFAPEASPPRGSNCRWCKRPRSTPNTIVKHNPGLFLPFHRNECLPCKNYNAVAHRHVRHGALKKLLEDKHELELHIAGVREWEALYKDSDTGRIKKGAIGKMELKTDIMSAEGSQLSFERTLGIWWPLSLWEEKHGRRADPRKIYKLEEDGKFLPGVIMSEADGCPLGCVKMAKKWFKGVERHCELEKTDRELPEGQIDSTWAKAQQTVSEFDIDWSEVWPAMPCPPPPLRTH